MNSLEFLEVEAQHEGKAEVIQAILPTAASVQGAEVAVPTSGPAEQDRRGRQEPSPQVPGLPF